MKFNAWVKRVTPYIWGGLWLIAITLTSIGAVIWSFKWILSLLGVL